MFQIEHWIFRWQIAQKTLKSLSSIFDANFVTGFLTTFINRFCLWHRLQKLLNDNYLWFFFLFFIERATMLGSKGTKILSFASSFNDYLYDYWSFMVPFLRIKSQEAPSLKFTPLQLFDYLERCRVQTGMHILYTTSLVKY